MNLPIFLLIALAILAAVFIFSRFSRGRYGSLHLNPSVGAAFEAFLVDGEMQYYISGPDACPNAVMGLSRGWQLRESLWKEGVLTAGEMKALVMAMADRHPCHGFDILDHQGRKIGVWFSAIDTFTTITILDRGGVSVATPPFDQVSGAP